MARSAQILCQWLHLICYLSLGSASTWSEWWSYEGISGPHFWGRVNPESWALCSVGKKQSPIDIEPKNLLFDPNLKHIHVSKHRVGGILTNDGHMVKFIVDDPHYVNISGGPSPYQFKVTEILFHFGSIDSLGSEHTIDGESFPAEVQIMGYNSDIYGNFTQAVYSANGLIILGILGKVGKKPNDEFKMIAQQLKDVRYKDQNVRIRHMSVHDLLPETNDYMTYEGALTMPGCFETVTWVIFNSPLLISNDDLMTLRDIYRGEETSPMSKMENNFKQPTNLNGRPIRTNINFKNPTKGCTMDRGIQYQANTWDRS